MKIYIVTDLEGVGGIVLPKQVGLEGTNEPMYHRACKLLTEEVNSAVSGAFDGGAKEVVVLDGHGANSAYNFVYEDLDNRGQYIMGAPWGRCLPGLDETFDMMFMLGCHAMAGTEKGILDHTMSSVTWVNAWLNSIKVGEIGMYSAYAGHFGVPTTLVVGDDAACHEAKKILGANIETVATKKGFSRTCAQLLSANKVCGLIREKSKLALQLKLKVKPVKLKKPVELKIQCLKTENVLGYKNRGAELVDSRTVVFKGRDILEVYRKWYG